MRIKDSMIHSYGGTEIDTTKISNTTLYKDKIFLPYGGTLPSDLAEGKAAIRITLQVGLSVNIHLYVNMDGTTKKYPVQASTEEIKTILERFFYDFKGNTGYTRFNCGLNKYWLGQYQSSFGHWKRLVRDTCGFSGLLDQLTADKQDDMMRYLAFLAEKRAA